MLKKNLLMFFRSSVVFTGKNLRERTPSIGVFFLFIALGNCLVLTCFIVPSMAQLSPHPLSSTSNKLEAQASPVIGWEFSGSPTLNHITLRVTEYQGDCPGTTGLSPIEARFTSSTTPPAPGRRVVVKNVSIGVNTDPYPFTDREYFRGRSSEAANMEFGTDSRPKSLLVAENKSGYLFLYDRNNINSGPLQLLQMAPSGGFIGIPAFSPVTNMVYVSNTSSSGNYKEGMVALRVIGNCTLQLAWQQPAGNLGPTVFSPPTVANGIVYHANGLGKQVFAFDANTGSRLWISPQFSGPVFATPTVVNGRLYIGSYEGKLRAFGI